MPSMKEIKEFGQIAPWYIRLLNPKAAEFLTGVGIAAKTVSIENMGQAVKHLNMSERKIVIDGNSGAISVEVEDVGEAIKLAVCGILVNTALYNYGEIKTEVDGKKLITRSQGSRKECLAIVKEYQRQMRKLYNSVKSS
jgi:hypothetical protein